jgi:hypothetical protein
MAIIVVILQVSGPGLGVVAASASVSKVDEAVRIRSELGLNSDIAYVTQSLADPIGFPMRDYYDVPLSFAEATELARRIDVQQSVKPAREWASTQSAWAGSYVDQAHGGVPVFLFADDPERFRAQLASRMPIGTSFLVLRTARSLADLERIKETVKSVWRLVESEGIDLQSAGPDVLANTVDVGVIGLTGDEEARILAMFPSGVTVHLEQPLFHDSCISRANCPSPFKGGLKITPPNGNWCTIAYIGEYLNSTPASLRAVTAGHCLYYGGGTSGVPWYHNGVLVGYSQQSTYAVGADGDVGIISLTNDGFADNLVFASATYDIRSFTSYALLGEIGVNDFMCRSGATTGWLCGRIKYLDRTKDVDNKLIDHQNVLDFDASKGDSGAPYMISSEFDGIHSDSTDSAPFESWYTPYVWASQLIPSVSICLHSTC